MKYFALFIVVAFVTDDVRCIEKVSSCFDLIARLSTDDKRLGNRASDKIAIGQNATSANEFVKKVTEKKSTANQFKCGETMAWVSEVFVGLESQYTEYKNRKQGKKAGYNNYIGEDLLKLFKEQKASKNPIIYHLQHVGTVDHVFTIEQIPPDTTTTTNGSTTTAGPSYRIYQSYNGAYSLNAWLSKAVTPELSKNGDIIIPHLTRCIRDNRDQSPLCDQMRKIFQSFEPIFAGKSAQFDEFKRFIQEYNISTAVGEFTKSWSKFGRGRQLSECEFFNDFLLKLRAVTEFYNDYSKTSTPYCSVISNYWIELHASPEPMRYPGLPSNMLAPIFTKVDYPSGYGFEVKFVSLSANKAEVNEKCTKNANVLISSLRT